MHLIHWMQTGGTLLTAESLLLFFPIVGATLVYGSIRRGYYLLVETGKDRKKMPFQSRAGVQEIRSFLDSVKADVGYVIEAEWLPSE